MASPFHPFTPDVDAGIGACGEAALLARIRNWLGDAMPPPPCGMGDDASVLPRDVGNLLAADPVIWGVHVDAAVPPAAVGAKLLKRNLSDMAAMGGEPRYATVTLQAGPDLAITWLEAFTRGLATCAQRYGVAIVGGDLAQTPRGQMSASLTLTGHTTRPLLRTGGQPGDAIWVTGELGGSRWGRDWQFVPRVREGQALATMDAVHALIDVTDGLGKDLPALLPAGTEAVIDLHALPLSPFAYQAAAASGQPAWAHALADGEDYELALLCARDFDPRTQWDTSRLAPLTRIGLVRSCPSAEAPDKVLRAADNERILTAHDGYAHFRRA